MLDSVKSSGKVRVSCAFTAATYPSSNADPTATASVSHAVSAAEAWNDASAAALPISPWTIVPRLVLMLAPFRIYIHSYTMPCVTREPSSRRRGGREVAVQGQRGDKLDDAGDEPHRDCETPSEVVVIQRLEKEAAAGRADETAKLVADRPCGRYPRLFPHDRWRKRLSDLTETDRWSCRRSRRMRLAAAQKSRLLG